MLEEPLLEPIEPTLELGKFLPVLVEAAPIEQVEPEPALVLEVDAVEPTRPELPPQPRWTFEKLGGYRTQTMLPDAFRLGSAGLTDPQKRNNCRESPQAGHESKLLAAFRALMLSSESFSLSLRKGGTSIMRFNPLITALIGALQDYLLSATPR